MKRPALQNKLVEVLRMAFRARKVFGTFEKRAPGQLPKRELMQSPTRTVEVYRGMSLWVQSNFNELMVLIALVCWIVTYPVESFIHFFNNSRWTSNQRKMGPAKLKISFGSD